MYDVMDHFNNCHSMKPMCVHVTEITWVKQNATRYNRILVLLLFLGLVSLQSTNDGYHKGRMSS